MAVLMKGNEAVAEAALRAGCRFYAGYPITPQSEILEYMARHMEPAGGVFIQGESELASISLVWGAAAAGARAMTSSSGPGFSLMQEGIAYIASYAVPAVLVNVMRYGVGGGDITQGQDSYRQAVKGGGNGDYHLLVLAPASVQECADLTYVAFELAERYRNPVLILSDGAIGQMVELCELPASVQHDIDKYDWVIRGRAPGETKSKATNLNWYMGEAEWGRFVRERYRLAARSEQRWETLELDDAQVVLVAYGISSRVCRQAVRMARARGLRVGLLRPISLWPFPRKAFEALPDTVLGLLSVEMSVLGQMTEDIRLATRCRKPVYSLCTAIDVPRAEEILKQCEAILNGELREEVEQ